MSANSQKNESINLKVHGFSFDSSKLKKMRWKLILGPLLSKSGLIYSGLQTYQGFCHHRSWKFLS